MAIEMVEDCLLHMHDVEIGLNLDDPEIALQHAATMDDWDACIGAFGERVVGAYVAGEADDAHYHPRLSEGIARIDTDDGHAVIAQWFEDGRYDTGTTHSLMADRIMQDYADEHPHVDDDDSREEEEDAS